MRGKAKAVALDKDLSRITPAYAGKSVFLPIFGALMLVDHPRLCGEKGNIVEISGSITGSPPPMRGKVPDHIQHE